VDGGRLEPWGNWSCVRQVLQIAFWHVVASLKPAAENGPKENAGGQVLKNQLQGGEAAGGEVVPKIRTVL